MAGFTPENEKRARQMMALYPNARSALIPMLHLGQEQNGWLSPEIIKHIAQLLNLTAAEVLSVASFYDMFHTEPVGKNVVGICTNLACMLEGAYDLLEHAEEHLGVKVGGTTADGEFTLEEVECVATCDKAPVCGVNWRYFHKFTKDDFDKLIDDVRNRKLVSEVPNHGTISRVKRAVALPGRQGSEGGEN